MLGAEGTRARWGHGEGHPTGQPLPRVADLFLQGPTIAMWGEPSEPTLAGAIERQGTAR